MNNRKAFLDTIAYSELGPALIALSDNGYNCIVGSTPSNPILFESYADHPRMLSKLPKIGIKSTAAGKFQILARYFDAYKKQLNLPDFSPDSQDKIALQMIKECHALDDVDVGRFEVALTKCASRWASLPNSTYGQHVNKLSDLQAAYEASGGTICA